MDENPKLAANFRKRQEMMGQAETPQSKYQKAVDEYKSLLQDRTHPKNRTAAYEKNFMAIFNRLMVAADELDGHNPGQGIFGLIILALRANLALKDKNIELEVQIKELEKRVKRLDKQ